LSFELTNLKNKIIIAPLADVSDAPFRKINKMLGADLTFTQMVSAQGAITNKFETLRYLVFARDEKPIGVQILGNDPDIIGDFISEVIRLKPDIIDLNCGCPAQKVVSQNMGASLLDDPVLLEKIIKVMVKKSKGIPISVKLRLGKNKSKINIYENVKIAEGAGVSLITIHGRTRDDKYNVNSDWDAIKKVVENVKIPIIGNGNLFTPEDIKSFLEYTGCAGVMLARGIIGNPFLIERSKVYLQTGVLPELPSIDKVYEILKLHIILISKEYNEINALPKIKKNIVWYLRFFDGISVLLNKIFSFNDIHSILEYLDLHVLNIKNKIYDKEDLSIIDKKFKERIIFWLNDNLLIGS
jgi:nifR3 family TIM-barrel protein